MKTTRDQAAAVSIDDLVARAKRIPLPKSIDKYTRAETTIDCLIARTSALGGIYQSRASFLHELSQTLGSAQKQGRGLTRKSSRALDKIFYAWGNDCNEEFNQDLAMICRFIAGDLVLLENGDVVSRREAA